MRRWWIMELCIWAETKQQSTLWVFQDELNSTKDLCGKGSQTIGFPFLRHYRLYGKSGVRATQNGQFWIVYDNWFARTHRKNYKQKKGESFSIMAMRDLTHGLKGVFDKPKHRIDELSAVHPWFVIQWLFFRHIKNKLRGQQFSTLEDEVHVLKTHVLELLLLEWEKSAQMHAKVYWFFMENILKINKTNFDHKYLFFHSKFRNINSNHRIRMTKYRTLKMMWIRT